MVSYSFLDDVECKRLTVTIVFATGFKEVSGSVGADGFSASLTVKGTLGAKGQAEETDVICADGTLR